MSARPLIEFDVDRFQPMRTQAVRHHLVGHPLLELPSLIALVQRHAPSGEVRFHNDAASAGTDFRTAPGSHPVHRSPMEIIEDIENARAWLSLMNVQKDPVYGAFVDEVLDSVQPLIDRVDPGMHHRAGWIFLTSPDAVTPYHPDHEHNFILQVRGKKTISVFDPLDRRIVSERALELFHQQWSRDLIPYREEHQSSASVFQVEPGMGAYIPVTAPHWVKNGPNVSITISFTYYTRDTVRRERLYKGNHLLRRLGLSPTPVGKSPLRDGAKDAALRAARGVLTPMKRVFKRKRPAAPVSPNY